MNTKLKNLNHLDAFLLGIEEEILKLSDCTILSEDVDLFAHVEDIRVQINSIIHAHPSFDNSLPPPVIEGSSLNTRSESVPVVPREAADRRKLLESLIANRLNMPQQVRVAFSARKGPTESEVDEMVDQLVRLGILNTTDTSDTE